MFGFVSSSLFLFFTYLFLFVFNEAFGFSIELYVVVDDHFSMDVSDFFP
jgi:hypothetical protein